MKQPAVVIGLGEMGGVFARGLLRLGHPVYPVLRGQDLRSCAAQYPEPLLTLVAVGEADLRAVLDALPNAWAGGLVLLQNELLPDDWAGFDQATVISVWFEKKPRQDAKVIIPSPVFGPHAELVASALAAIGIPADVLGTPEELVIELATKNLYILTANICGLEVGGTVGALFDDHRNLAEKVSAEVMDLQDGLLERRLPRAHLVARLRAAIAGDPEHKCLGRSALARLRRAVSQAEEIGLEIPTLHEMLQLHDTK